MPKNKPRHDTLLRENRELRRQLAEKPGRQTQREIFKTIRELCKPAIMLGIPCWAAVEIFNAWAGTATDVNIAVEFIGSLKVSTTIVFSYSLVATWYGWKQRRLRLRVVSSQDIHIKELETGYDPDRSSSGLDSQGQPRQEDDS
ncbi:MAG: hypothetical protein PF501_03015 [Salinisphaera sp.]|jgi:hypothetical protein|nr:hypothetical protein [Salinisphaera sp.]